MLVLLLAAAVKDVPAPLRTGCSADAPTVTILPAGAPVTIRYSISGDSEPCYKVSVQVDGKTLEGSLPASAVTGLEDFDQARHKAVWLDTAAVVETIRASTALPSLRAGGRTGLAQQAVDLISSSRPQKALEILEPELRSHRDANLLALAGVAAWRSDDSTQALEYWRASLVIAPSPDVERLYRQVEREAKGDQSTERLYGLRVLLRYESSVVPIETARQITAVLDQEFSSISQQLGCSAQERVIAIVQSRDAYRKTTDSAEWSAGQFDGKIRVPVFDPKVLDKTMLRSLEHETTHACLTMLGHWPAWLQEGIAQKLSGDTLSAAQTKRIGELVQQGKLPHLSNLRQGLVASGRRARSGCVCSIARRSGVAVEGFGRRGYSEFAAESRAAAAGDSGVGSEAGVVNPMFKNALLIAVVCLAIGIGIGCAQDSFLRRSAPSFFMVVPSIAGAAVPLIEGVITAVIGVLLYWLLQSNLTLSLLACSATIAVLAGAVTTLLVEPRLGISGVFYLDATKRDLHL